MIKAKHVLGGVGLATGVAITAVLANSSADNNTYFAPPADTSASAHELMISELALPVNKTAIYYNRATNTAFREACLPANEKAVTCRLDALGMTAQIAHSLQTTYAVGEGNRITAQTNLIGADHWSSAYTAEYKGAKQAAQFLQWSAGSPLAHVAQNQGRDIVQNAVAEITPHGSDGVAYCSIVPVSEKRGFAACIAFDAARNEVRSAVLPRLEATGALNETLLAPQAVSRGFNRDDADYLARYVKSLNGGAGPAYIFRKD